MRVATRVGVGQHERLVVGGEVVADRLAGTLVAQVVLLAWMAQYGAVPLKPALLIAMAVVPAFWKVMVIGALVAPTFVVGKFSVVGETFTAVPSPLISKPCFSSVKLP